MKTAKLVRLAIIVCLAFSPILSKAQFDDPDDVLDNPVPFDGGVTMLVAAGIIYGLKKAYGNKNCSLETGLLKQ